MSLLAPRRHLRLFAPLLYLVLIFAASACEDTPTVDNVTDKLAEDLEQRQQLSQSIDSLAGQLIQYATNANLIEPALYAGWSADQNLAVLEKIQNLPDSSRTPGLERLALKILFEEGFRREARALGDSLRMTGQPELAREVYLELQHQLLVHTPGREESRNAVGDSLIGLYSTSNELRTSLALAFLRLQSWQRADSILKDRVLTSSPPSPGSTEYRLLARAQRRLGRSLENSFWYANYRPSSTSERLLILHNLAGYEPKAEIDSSHIIYNLTADTLLQIGHRKQITVSPSNQVLTVPFMLPASPNDGFNVTTSSKAVKTSGSRRGDFYIAELTFPELDTLQQINVEVSYDHHVEFPGDTALYSVEHRPVFPSKATLVGGEGLRPVPDRLVDHSEARTTAVSQTRVSPRKFDIVFNKPTGITRLFASFSKDENILWNVNLLLFGSGVGLLALLTIGVALHAAPRVAGLAGVLVLIVGGLPAMFHDFLGDFPLFDNIANHLFQLLGPTTTIDQAALGMGVTGSGLFVVTVGAWLVVRKIDELKGAGVSETVTTVFPASLCGVIGAFYAAAVEQLFNYFTWHAFTVLALAASGASLLWAAIIFTRIEMGLKFGLTSFVGFVGGFGIASWGPPDWLQIILWIISGLSVAGVGVLWLMSTSSIPSSVEEDESTIEFFEGMAVGFWERHKEVMQLVALISGIVVAIIEIFQSI